MANGSSAHQDRINQWAHWDSAQGPKFSGPQKRKQ